MPMVDEVVEELELLGEVVDEELVTDELDEVVVPDDELVRLELELVVALMLDDIEDMEDIDELDVSLARRRRVAVTVEPLAEMSVRPESVMLPSLYVTRAVFSSSHSMSVTAKRLPVVAERGESVAMLLRM